MTSINHTKLQRQLCDALKPYNPKLNDWLDSGYCFLTPQEIHMLAYATTFSHPRLLAEQYHCAEDVILNLLRLLHEKLARNINFYNKFVSDYKGRAVSGSTSGLKAEVFLNAPIQSVLPQPLILKLSVCGKTMKDILSNYTVHDLMGLRHFGPTKLLTLKAILDQHECLELLVETKS